MPDLLDKLLAKPQRETVGSDASARFDYQKNWAFCEMLRRHMEGADYLIAFEFHDDVVFLAPNPPPGAAEFFQVKTSRSAAPRKLASLTTRARGSNSILGKMFKNFAGIWSGHLVKVILVSNVAFEFADSGLSAVGLDPKYRKRIIEKLKTELPDFLEDQVNNLHFMITGVSIDAMQSFLHGEAMGLFKARFGEDHGLNVHSWVRLVQSEITRKNNYLSDTIVSVPDLISKKCINKTFVEDTLALVSTQTRIALDMGIVNAELKSCGWTASDLIKLGKRIPTAASDYVDATNTEVVGLVERLRQVLAGLASPDLCKLISDAENTLLSSLSGPYRDRIYLAAISVVVFHEES